PVLNDAVHFQKRTQIVGSQAERELINDAVEKALWLQCQTVMAVEFCRGQKIDLPPTVHRHADARVQQWLGLPCPIVHTDSKRLPREKHVLISAVLVQQLDSGESDEACSLAVTAGS